MNTLSKQILRYFPSIVHSLIVTLLIFATMTGCESNMAVKRMQAKNPLAKNSPKAPTKMVDVWNTYAQTTPEGGAVRGIAGRVHFYNDAKKKQAVKVDGNLTVFIFDGKETDPAHAKPLKIYQFKSETLDKHYAYKKPLGHGYDFFMPFDEIGGEEKNLCVMARFDDNLENTLVLSPPVNTVLKGTKPQTRENPMQEFLTKNSILTKANQELQVKEQPGGIQQVGFENGKPTPNQSGMERNVTTIPLNDPMTRRLTQNTPATTADPPPMPLPPSSSPLPTEPLTAPKTDIQHPFDKNEMKFPDSSFKGDFSK